MTCREAVSRMTDLECGELDGGEARETRGHLAGCLCCLRYWRGYRTAVVLGRRACRDGSPADSRVPEDFVESVLAAARRRSGFSLPARHAVHLLSGIAAAPLLAFYLP